AVSQKRGKFERAGGGTLFLDEVGELSLDAQVRLLRVIQFKEIERVGGTRTVHVDVRIIAATHRNLEDLIRSGKFREDLYYRLNVFPIYIKPLRERKQDIPALVRYFVEKKARDLNCYPAPKLANHAMDQLMDYDWPGNVRELSNIIERSLIMNRQNPLSFQHLQSSGHATKTGGAQEITDDNEIIPLDEMIIGHIQKALKKTGGRIEGPKGAATLLNLHPNTLRSKIKKLKITKNSIN
ncbi:MAG: sigma 54-interacting transcriptional regulator, partial [Firmicutes bacterium]|nr:sigma 54-interacting transcriptional regulator [Bacillota bacterium]